MSEQNTPKKNNKKIVVIAVIVVAVIAVLAFVLTVDMRTYSKASELEATGAYTEAIAVYETIPDYKDVQVRINECNYQLALALEAEDNYVDALIAFEALGDYADAPAHVNECNYQLALALEAEGNFADALIAFEALGDYADAPAHVNECDYQLALALEAEGNYVDALITFEALGDYADAPTHVNECKYQIALHTENNGSAMEALTLFTELGEYKDSAEHIWTINTAISECNEEIERIAAQRAEYDAAVVKATSVLEEGETPLDAATITGVNEALNAGALLIIDTPALPSNLHEIESVTEQLLQVDYSGATKAITDATVELENSITQYGYVNAPTEDYVIDRLMRVPAIAYIAAVTEDNDPNNQLGKAGGYTAQVYFSSTMVSSAYASMPEMDIIEAGTDCGGSIEVYSTFEDANRRNEYLASFDGTMFASGSHTVIGTLVVRTSNELTASEQKELEAAVIESLISLDPAPIIQRVIVEDEDSTEVPTDETIAVDTDVEIIASTGELVTITEYGYTVDNGWLHYALIAHNNTDTAIEYPEFRITTRDAEGNLLGVETQVLAVMYPGQDVVWASLGGEVTDVPASIEVELVDPEPYNLVKPIKLDHPEYTPLVVKNASIKVDDYFGTLIGEVHNPNDYAISSAAITIIYRDENGTLLAGETGYCDGIGAGKTIPFEIYVNTDISTDTYEVFAMPW